MTFGCTNPREARISKVMLMIPGWEEVANQATILGVGLDVLVVLNYFLCSVNSFTL